MWESLVLRARALSRCPGRPRQEGPLGLQGDVSLQQLSDAIQTSSTNSSSVGTLDAEALRNQVNELIRALRWNP